MWVPVRSMTGFGFAEREQPGDDGRRLVVELRAVNAKYLELKIRQPFGVAFERKIRQRVESRIGRGRVELSIRQMTAPDGEIRTALDSLSSAAITSALGGLIRLRERAGEVGVDLRPPTVTELARYIESNLPSQRQDEVKPPEFLLELVDEALDQLDAMRLKEGDATATTLSDIFDELAGRVAEIDEARAKDGPRTREMIIQRLEALGQGGSPTPIDIEPARLAQEAALVAAKGDVAEEFARIASHLAQAREVLAAPAHSGQGKTLDFLSQELMREVTTIGSKVIDHRASGLVIKAKTCVDRVREQAQNVE